MSIRQYFTCPQCGMPVTSNSGGWYCPNGHMTSVSVQYECGTVPTYGSRGPQGTITVTVGTRIGRRTV